MGTENEPSERLEGSDGSQRGGLVIKKKAKKSGDDSGDSGFKKPSIYGLEKRAKEKREEQRRESEREKIISSRDKKYRERRVETPSNTGGVSDKYRERRREREDYERSKRNYVSSRDRDRRDRDDDRERGSRDNWEDDDDDRRSRRGSHRSWETPTPGRTPRESPSPYVGSRFVHSWERYYTKLISCFLDQNEVILEGKKLHWQHQVTNIMIGVPKRLIIKVRVVRPINQTVDLNIFLGKEDGSESTRMSWNEAELKEYEADQKQADRDWYTMDEGNDPNRLDPDQDYVAKKEEQMKKKRDNMKLSGKSY